MSDTQRIIKKCAICFAWLLVFSIFSGLFGAIFAVGSLFDDSKDIISHENVINVAEKSIKELDIEFESVKFIIRQTGDDFGISKSEYIDVKPTSGGIYISEKRRGLFEKRTDTVVLSIPDDFIFEEVSIETGAGKLEIDGLQTKTLDLELGAGKGVFIADLAVKHPEINYIAIDIKSDVLGYARRNIEKSYTEAGQKVENVLLTAYNIEQIKDIFSEEDQIDRIYINFCNPWPKAKHNKRRLTHTKQLELYKTFLKPQGEIHFSFFHLSKKCMQVI